MRRIRGGYRGIEEGRREEDRKEAVEGEEEGGGEEIVPSPYLLFRHSSPSLLSCLFPSSSHSLNYIGLKKKMKTNLIEIIQ